MLNIARPHEEARLGALYAFEVLDTAPEEAFDRITRLAKTVLQVPTVLISLIDRDRQWFKSRQGCDVTETSRDISFCSQAIALAEPLVVEDASLDPRFSGNPSVTGPSHVRFYIGVQLKNRDGFNLGTLCCVDTKPRKATDEQIAILQDLGRLVMDELELRLLATTDSLTGAMTRRAFMEAVRRDVALARRHGRPLTCIMIDADHFKAVNDTYGHATGDTVLRTITSVCSTQLRSSDYIGRLGGEEFAIILREIEADAGFGVAERLRTMIERETFLTPKGPFSVTVSAGIAAVDIGVSESGELLENADAALYRAKTTGRNRTVMHDEAARGYSLTA